jgi:hypothetical protein
MKNANIIVATNTIFIIKNAKKWEKRNDYFQLGHYDFIVRQRLLPQKPIPYIMFVIGMEKRYRDRQGILANYQIGMRKNQWCYVHTDKNIVALTTH